MVRLRPCSVGLLLLAFVALGGACGEDPAATPPPAAGLGPLPGVDALPEQAALPDLFLSWDGARTASSPDDFRTWRSDELRQLFAHYIYGDSPAAPGPVEAQLLVRVDDLLDGKVVYEEVALRFGPPGTPPLHLALFSPRDVEKPPVFLGLNKCGNQSLTTDPRVRLTTAFIHGDCGPSAESTRGVHASYFPLELIASRGFALATFHESDAAPDDEKRADEGLRPRFPAPGPEEARWGVIATWSWALSRAVDFLDGSGKVDPARLAVVGHSRRGKAALWAGANDPRIDLVVAHQSGTAGAALSRSLAGESVEAINLFFPHWFNGVFPTFGKSELRLPVDQHQLLALLAPRPVLISDGDEDDWADPAGARAAVLAADPAWKLLGSAGVALDDAGQPRRDAPLAWSTRPGGHSIGPEDWSIFLDFAAAQPGW